MGGAVMPFYGANPGCDSQILAYPDTIYVNQVEFFALKLFSIAAYKLA